ncbi:FGGY family carbohydrate kinase [Lysinibacter cavernae]|uniref:Sugar (Pentulose or hexulose) kinase n=1 Tax=Lysinibacter cavernae TaxID=1640652 RepID=A0A7X5R3Y6_9MICO|nr:FGGY family carbohydrate kinase [Lysinibacter cavernae]NIH55136.1 sugar (pentulose or hexulose) kinase [Lysinibacter cavernae]
MTLTVTIGLDLGTTVSKAIARLADGETIGTANRSSTWLTTSDGHTETDANGYIELAIGLLNDVVAEAEALRGPVSVSAVGITGLAESGVLLNSSGQPIAPVVAWFDRRGETETALISKHAPAFASAFAAATGLPWDCQPSVAKLLSFRAAGIPITQGSRWLSVQEWVAFALGADQVREPSLASRTGLIDQDTGELWEPIRELAGLPARFLPPAVTAGVSAGILKHAGLPAQYADAIVTVAGHDHPVAAVGAGAVGPDAVFNSSGTADVVLRSISGEVDAATRLSLVRAGWSLGAHVLPQTSLLIGGARGGLFLRRILNLLGAQDQPERDALDLAATSVGDLPEGLLLSGTGPTGDDVQIALRDDASPAALWAAATRLTAGNLHDLLESLGPIVGRSGEIVAAGGWTRMMSVRLAKRAAMPGIRFAKDDQPGLVGAAMFARQAAEPLASFAASAPTNQHHI